MWNSASSVKDAREVLYPPPCLRLRGSVDHLFFWHRARSVRRLPARVGGCGRCGCDDHARASADALNVNKHGSLLVLSQRTAIFFQLDETFTFSARPLFTGGLLTTRAGEHLPGCGPHSRRPYHEMIPRVGRAPNLSIMFCCLVLAVCRLPFAWSLHPCIGGSFLSWRARHVGLASAASP